MKKLSPHERMWAAGLLIAALCLGVKSYGLDAWEPGKSEQLSWSATVSQALADEPDSWLQDKGLLMERVVAVKETSGDEASGQETLRITVRSYIGGYLPIGDRKLMAVIKEN